MPKLYPEKALHDACTPDNCKLLQQRLKTFKEWSGVFSKEELADAGFVSDGQPNEVYCMECNLHINLHSWDPRPKMKHQKNSPNCPFVLKHRKEDVKNQPIKQNQRQDYSDIKKRLKSFEGWPLGDVALRPEVMSRCGYYYTGSADKVVCFFCGLELRDWINGHCPIHRHKKMGNCSFISPTEAVCIKQEIEYLQELKDFDDYNYTQIFHTILRNPSCILEGKTCTNQQCQSFEPVSGNLDTTEENPSFVGEHTQYSDLQKRLDSFISWPLNNVAHSPEIMSESGFFYTGSSDKVVCFSCGVTLRGWQDGDSPPARHRESSPDCSHVFDLDIGAIERNISELKCLKMQYDDYNWTEMFEDTSTRPVELFREGFICGEVCPKEWQEDHTREQIQQNKSCDKWPEFSTEQSRLASFTSWPLSQVAHSAEMMSRSGFFYTGSADRVTCFSCGVTLRDWEDNDIPGKVHRDISESCPFIEELDLEVIERDLRELEELLYFDDYNCTESFDRKARRKFDSGVRVSASKFVAICTEDGSTS